MASSSNPSPPGHQILRSDASEVILLDEDYRRLATNAFQEYARVDIEDSLLLEAIQIDFEHRTKENWEAIDGSTWMTIKQHCIPRGVWIDHYRNNGTRTEILMKLVSTDYDDDLKNWDMNRIDELVLSIKVGGVAILLKPWM